MVTESSMVIPTRLCTGGLTRTLLMNGHRTVGPTLASQRDQNHSAQGSPASAGLPWGTIPIVINPERVESIPHIPLVEFDLIPFKKKTKLIRE